MGLRLAAALLAALAPGPAFAAPVTTATPVFHGVLDVLAARGTINPTTGSATLKVHRWRLLLSPDSDGIYPDQEPILIAIDSNNYYLAAGSMKSSANGKRFTYKGPRDAGPRAIRSVRITRGRYAYYVSFTLTGVDFSSLTIQNRKCVPTAFIVGDDDGFSGSRLRRPSFESRALFLPGGCILDSSEWPWLQ
jgi:hypothetical protein